MDRHDVQNHGCGVRMVLDLLCSGRLGHELLDPEPVYRRHQRNVR